VERITIVGLGYVGLPLALAFAKKFPTVGFDIDTGRVAELRAHHDRTREVSAESLAATTLQFTAESKDLAGTTAFIVTVPTPVDVSRQPDLTAVRAATTTVARAMKSGAIVVYESTVYPGVTEEICRPLLEKVSGLRAGVDFKVGYSPERINPGDHKHRLEHIVKVVSGEDAEALERVAAIYGPIIDAGIHRAPSVKVAEAAKVLENTQRDLNIALMNELALICDRLGVPTRDVLAAARTKWNFLPFSPGLVGGHCIGVDPYYLTAKAESLGYHPQVILAGRRVNDGMGTWVAQRVIKMLLRRELSLRGARIGIFGLTFKEDVPDLRNSRVPDIVAELRQFGVEPLIADPLADPEEAKHELGLFLRPHQDLVDLDAAIVAVAHAPYREWGSEAFAVRVKPGGALFDVKAILNPATLPTTIEYGSL
jgi:UDP-N-acetyl-D-galactosamine dehydrogenase